MSYSDLCHCHSLMESSINSLQTKRLPKVRLESFSTKSDQVELKMLFSPFINELMILPLGQRHLTIREGEDDTRIALTQLVNRSSKGVNRQIYFSGALTRSGMLSCLRRSSIESVKAIGSSQPLG